METNLGVSFEWTVLLIILIAGLLFYVKDFKLGIVMHFLATGLLFIWFFAADLNYIPSLVFFFIFLVMLSFTFYGVATTTKKGSII